MQTWHANSSTWQMTFICSCTDCISAEAKATRLTYDQKQTPPPSPKKKEEKRRKKKENDITLNGKESVGSESVEVWLRYYLRQSYTCIHHIFHIIPLLGAIPKLVSLKIQCMYMCIHERQIHENEFPTAFVYRKIWTKINQSNYIWFFFLQREYMQMKKKLYIIVV